MSPAGVYLQTHLSHKNSRRQATILLFHCNISHAFIFRDAPDQRFCFSKALLEQFFTERAAMSRHQP